MHRHELKSKGIAMKDWATKSHGMAPNSRAERGHGTASQRTGMLRKGFAVSVIREARIRAKFWFTAWLVTFVVLITVVAAVLVM
jgi:hypothetical protein